MDPRIPHTATPALEIVRNGIYDLGVQALLRLTLSKIYTITWHGRDLIVVTYNYQHEGTI